jgi:plastocyanin
MRKRHSLASLLSFVGAVTIITACGGGGEKTGTPPAAQPPAAPGGPITPSAGGQVIKVEMITDDQGNNKFVPNNIEAHPGDVLRFTLVTGVHNVHFLPDSNPGMQGLPAASPMLQAPGQTFDIAVDFKPGHYYFQCDPHALLGMIGRLEVEER